MFLILQKYEQVKFRLAFYMSWSCYIASLYFRVFSFRLRIQKLDRK